MSVLIIKIKYCIKSLCCRTQTIEGLVGSQSSKIQGHIGWQSTRSRTSHISVLSTVIFVYKLDIWAVCIYGHNPIIHIQSSRSEVTGSRWPHQSGTLRVCHICVTTLKKETRKGKFVKTMFDIGSTFLNDFRSF